MVRLWIFLSDSITEAELYREFFNKKKIRRVDYRIFNGDTKTVESRLERIMEGKFICLGFNRLEVENLIEELAKAGEPQRVPYEEIRPLLKYLKENLKINPSRILNQYFYRYETGELKSVTKAIYVYASNLKKRTEKALNSGSKYEVEKLKETVFGKREGLTLFSEVEEDLEFLKKYGGKPLRSYLGRSISHYKKEKLKRVSSHVVQKIKSDCMALLKKNSELLLSALPKHNMRMEIGKLLTVLKTHSIKRIMDDIDGSFEKNILTSVNFSRKEYGLGESDLIEIDKAAYILGMSKMAFDLLVAAHTDVFGNIGTYRSRWYLPSRYLTVLKEQKGFDLIKAKYELIAKDYRVSHDTHPRSKKKNECFLTDPNRIS